jgi:hypothetical protein
MNKIICLFLSLSIADAYAQRDSFVLAQKPLLLTISPIFSKNHIGSQLILMKLMNQKEIRKQHSQKIILKERWWSADISFYTQKGLHNSLFLTSSYSFRRVNPHGFYRQLRPFLGISQTFLNEESYSVNQNNEVILNKLAGNFYLTGGMGLEIGKVLTEKQSKFFRDIHVGILAQIYYPNFRFIALRPSYQVGTSIELRRFSKNFKKKIIRK